MGKRTAPLRIVYVHMRYVCRCEWRGELMSDRLLKLIWVSSLLAISLLGGCASTYHLDSSGSEPWPPANSRMVSMGVSLVLPAGSWQVNEITPGHAIEFQDMAGSGRIVLMRVPSERIPSRQVALSRLFSHFPDKEQVFRGARVLRSGAEAALVEYVLMAKGEPLNVRACIVRGDEWVHELVTWGLDAATADSVADSLVFQQTP